jgi:peptide subunit release factor RF-3
VTSGTVEESQLPTGAKLANDTAGNLVALFPEQWALDFFIERNKTVTLSAKPPKA